jgi:hypothetical protein
MTSLQHHQLCPWGSTLASSRRPLSVSAKEDMFHPRPFGITTGPQHLSRSSISWQHLQEPRRSYTVNQYEAGSPKNVEDGTTRFVERISTASCIKRSTGENVLSMIVSPVRARQENVRPVTMHRLARRNISGILSRSMPADEFKQRTENTTEDKELTRARWYAVNYVQRMQENALCTQFINRAPDFRKT